MKTKKKLAYLPKDILQTLETYYQSNPSFIDFNDKQIQELVNRTVQFYTLVLQKWSYYKYVFDSKDKSGYEFNPEQFDIYGNFKWVYVPVENFKNLIYKPTVSNKQITIKSVTYYKALGELGLIEYKIDKTNTKPNAFFITNKFNLLTSDYELIELNNNIPKFNSERILKRTTIYSDVYNKQVSNFDKVKINTDIEEIITDLKSLGKSHAFVSFCVNQILRIYNKDFTATVDKTGRFHTLFSRLPSILYKYLSIGGKQLVEIDVKNCQFLLFSLLWNDGSESSKKFREITEKGLFYEELLPHAKKIFSDKKVDRNFVKKEISMSVLFKEIVDNEFCKKSEVLELAFPGIMNFLNTNYRYENKEDLKSIKSNIKKMENFRKQRESILKTKLLWVALQNLESDFILKSMTNFKGVYLSKHDAIVVQKGNEDNIVSILQNSFSSKGLKFTHTIKNL